MDALMTYAARYPGRPGYGAATADLPERRRAVARTVAKWIRKGAEVVRVTAAEASAGLRLADAEAERAMKEKNRNAN